MGRHSPVCTDGCSWASWWPYLWHVACCPVFGLQIHRFGSCTVIRLVPPQLHSVAAFCCCVSSGSETIGGAMRYCVGEGIRASLFAGIKIETCLFPNVAVAHHYGACNIESYNFGSANKVLLFIQQYFFSGAALHVQEEHSHVIAILCCGCFRLYEQLLNMDICVGPLDSQEHKFRYRQKKCLQRNWILAKEN